jgi:ABC-2 type transport system ATP-binding protein
LLVLDDPALGLDPVARRALLESMIYVTRGDGRTIFFSSHLLEDVERVADHMAILDGSVLRACCPVETFRARVRQYVLGYSGNTAPPARLPDLPGLLHVRRSTSELRLSIVAATAQTHATLSTLGASSVEETPLALDDAMIGYLGNRGERRFFLEDTTALETARGVS